MKKKKSNVAMKLFIQIIQIKTTLHFKHKFSPLATDISSEHDVLQFGLKPLDGFLECILSGFALVLAEPKEASPLI